MSAVSLIEMSLSCTCCVLALYLANKIKKKSEQKKLCICLNLSDLCTCCVLGLHLFDLCTWHSVKGILHCEPGALFLVFIID